MTYYIHDEIELDTDTFYCKEHDVELPNTYFMKHLEDYHQK